MAAALGAVAVAVPPAAAAAAAAAAARIQAQLGACSGKRPTCGPAAPARDYSRALVTAIWRLGMNEGSLGGDNENE